MNVRTEAASQTATEIVLARVAQLEALGFVRPRSLSCDAYLVAIADLHEPWAEDSRSLASSYARRRFGEATDASDAVSVQAAADRVARSADGLSCSGQIADLVAAWRSRYSMSPESVEVASPEAMAVLGEVPTAETLVERAPVLPQRASSGLLSVRSASIRRAASAVLVGATLASVGAYCFSDGLRMFAAGFIGGSEPPPMPAAVVTMVSPSPFPALAANESDEPAWPHFYPTTYPHADQLNEPIAESLSELAAMYRDLGLMQHADAIYSYVARSRPYDYVAQMEYADYLLNAFEPPARDAVRACEYAEQAYVLNPGDPRTADLFAAALFATGDIARAVEIQQEWLDRDGRQPEIVLNAQKPTGSSAG